MSWISMIYCLLVCSIFGESLKSNEGPTVNVIVRELVGVDYNLLAGELAVEDSAIRVNCLANGGDLARCLLTRLVSTYIDRTGFEVLDAVEDIAQALERIDQTGRAKELRKIFFASSTSTANPPSSSSVESSSFTTELTSPSSFTDKLKTPSFATEPTSSTSSTAEPSPPSSSTTEPGPPTSSTAEPGPPSSSATEPGPPTSSTAEPSPPSIFPTDSATSSTENLISLSSSTVLPSFSSSFTAQPSISSPLTPEQSPSSSFTAESSNFHQLVDLWAKIGAGINNYISILKTIVSFVTALSVVIFHRCIVSGLKYIFKGRVQPSSANSSQATN